MKTWCRNLRFLLGACAALVTIACDGGGGGGSTVAGLVNGSGDASSAGPAAPASPGQFTVVTPANVPAVIGSFTDTSVAGMTRRLLSDFSGNTGYRTWSHDTLHYMVTLNTFGRTYVDPQLGAAIQAGQFPAPVGASSVLELYDDATATTPSGWAVLARGADADGADAWFSFEWVSDKGVFGDPQVDAMGASACTSCHAPEPGYIVPLGQ